MRIGICGGTFDPFHRGHLEPVLAVKEEMHWERILYVPAFQQPFKQARTAVSGYHRFAMAVLGTESVKEAVVSPMELERGAVSYTVETLEELRRRDATSSLDWIIGDDNLADLSKWKSVDRIWQLANFVVLTRSGAADFPTPAPFRVCDARSRGDSGCIVFARNETVPVSSTEIRRRIRAGEPVDELVDPRVWRYIQRNGLYQGDQGD